MQHRNGNVNQSHDYRDHDLIDKIGNDDGSYVMIVMRILNYNDTNSYGEEDISLR